MWFNKQGEALAYHDTRPDHIIIAKDISAHGHKRYGVFPLANVNIFQGPYNELIRTNSVCKLYFDLDGPPLNDLEGTRQVQLLIDEALVALGAHGFASHCPLFEHRRQVQQARHISQRALPE